MTFGPDHYVPVLKAKRGEKKAPHDHAPITVGSAADQGGQRLTQGSARHIDSGWHQALSSRHASQRPSWRPR